MDAQICDYGDSYIRWTGEFNPADPRKPGHMPWGNTVRIQLDSRCDLIDERTGETEEFFLITPCRTEWMYRSDALWQDPNREFVGVFSRTAMMAGHVGLGLAGNPGGDIDAVRSLEDSYPDFQVSLRYHAKARQLDSDDEVIEATLTGGPLVARTELRDEEHGRRAMLEYPIKTMNLQTEHRRMQVDTGPLLFPDLGRSVERSIERFSQAFVCYNTFDVAEFVLRGPTPVMADGHEVAKTIEYSDIRRLPAKTSIFSTG